MYVHITKFSSALSIRLIFSYASLQTPACGLRNPRTFARRRTQAARTCAWHVDCRRRSRVRHAADRGNRRRVALHLRPLRHRVVALRLCYHAKMSSSVLRAHLQTQSRANKVDVANRVAVLRATLPTNRDGVDGAFLVTILHFCTVHQTPINMYWRRLTSRNLFCSGGFRFGRRRLGVLARHREEFQGPKKQAFD